MSQLHQPAHHNVSIVTIINLSKSLSCYINAYVVINVTYSTSLQIGIVSRAHYPWASDARQAGHLRDALFLSFLISCEGLLSGDTTPCSMTRQRSSAIFLIPIEAVRVTAYRQHELMSSEEIIQTEQIH